MNDLMIDLETLGTTPDAMVIQIGAVQFDPAAGLMGEEFASHVAMAPTQGRKIDVDTVKWWFGQSTAARQQVLEGQRTAKPLREVLVAFGDWVFRTFGRAGPDRIWSHGATFDIVIMDDCFRSCGLATPWNYRAARDTRTLFELVQVEMSPLAEGETAHVAVHDARRQARTVTSAYGVLAARSCRCEKREAKP